MRVFNRADKIKQNGIDHSLETLRLCEVKTYFESENLSTF